MIDTSPPSRADVVSVINRLEGLPVDPSSATPSPVFAPAPAPQPLQHAAAGAPDQGAAQVEVASGAALRHVTIERDAWRAAAEDLRADLRRQLESVHAEAERQQTQAAGLGLELEQLRRYAESMRRSLETQGEVLQQQQATAEQQGAELAAARAELEALRCEVRTRDEQITHLTAAMTSLIEIAQGRLAGGTAPAAAAAPAAPRSLSRGNWDLAEPETTPLPAPDMVIPKLAPDTGTPFKTVRLGANTPKARTNPADAVPVIETAAS